MPDDSDDRSLTGPRPSRSAASSIVVDRRAAELRRRLGPTAWVVLEELLADVSGPGDPVVRTNVRQLAARLGLSKDTAARALRRLRSAGLVERQDARQASGAFGPVSYVVRLERVPGVALRPVERPTRPPTASAARRPSQGSLFDVRAEERRP